MYLYFRTPGTGLYSNLSKYNLPYPEAVFDITFFQANPKPFCLLAKEFYPENFIPTTAHNFIRLLEEKGLLVRHYTQNIDTLERIAGVSGEKLVEAHGSFAAAHCIKCKKEYATAFVKEAIFKDEVPKCTDCSSIIKPDIVFFGESLPKRFFQLKIEDFPKCDLLIIMGTSLKVHPFASLIHEIKSGVPRILINREIAGNLQCLDENSLDIGMLGDIQEKVEELATLLGWQDELKAKASQKSGKL